MKKRLSGEVLRCEGEWSVGCDLMDVERWPETAE